MRTYCHAKNLALLYANRKDAPLAPACDFLTTCVYASYQHNPLGICALGKKTWASGKTLSRFIAVTFGIPQKAQVQLLEPICDAVAEAVPQVRAKMEELPAFRETGKHMLLAWKEGIDELRDKHVDAIREMPAAEAFSADQSALHQCVQEP